MRHLALAVTLGVSPVVALVPTLAPAQSTTAPSTFWEKVKGSWTTSKGAMKEQWGKLTDDDLLEIEGRREQLIGKLQQRYGITREEAERQVGSWERTYQM